MADLKAFGATQDVIDTARANIVAAKDFELFEDNLLSVRAFQEMDTQWDRAGMEGIRVGLKLEVLPRVMRELGVPLAERNKVWGDVRIMEHEALKVYGEKAARK